MLMMMIIVDFFHLIFLSLWYWTLSSGPDDEMNMMTKRLSTDNIMTYNYMYAWAKTPYNEEVNMMTIHLLLPMWSYIQAHICTIAHMPQVNEKVTCEYDYKMMTIHTCLQTM